MIARVESRLCAALGPGIDRGEARRLANAWAGYRAMRWIHRRHGACGLLWAPAAGLPPAPPAGGAYLVPTESMPLAMQAAVLPAGWGWRMPAPGAGAGPWVLVLPVRVGLCAARLAVHSGDGPAALATMVGLLRNEWAAQWRWMMPGPDVCLAISGGRSQR